MDYLKTRAPFWKKEVGADGTGQWVDARDSDERAAERWESNEQPFGGATSSAIKQQINGLPTKSQR
ncbi:MAG: hypothetical protein HC869_13815 [Rhodospirillales bacterium]|nr:hypothetical protein [Rhodospirillales bacterium]